MTALVYKILEMVLVLSWLQTLKHLEYQVQMTLEPKNKTNSTQVWNIFKQKLFNFQKSQFNSNSIDFIRSFV